jgi:hypothetical protein
VIRVGQAFKSLLKNCGRNRFFRQARLKWPRPGDVGSIVGQALSLRRILNPPASSMKCTIRIFLLFFPLITAAQDQTGGIHGTVADALTHQPIRKAMLTFEFMTPAPGRGSQSHSAVTDASGGFALDSVPAGQYVITAQHPDYPQARPIRKKVEVKAGEISDGVTLELIPGGSISGHVLDEDGDPLPGCNVQAHPGARPNVIFQQSGVANPDESGEYRMFHLAPGKYTISANCFAQPFQTRAFSSGPDPPQSLAYATEYYESANDTKSAQVIEVAPGSEKSGVDFQMRTAAVTQIHGRFSPGGADWHGQPVGVRLIAIDSVALAPPPRLDQEKGTFDFPRVFPGSYYLAVFSNGTSENRIGAVERIEVKDKPVEVVLNLSHGIDLSGTLELENNDNNKKILPEQFNVQLTPEPMTGLGGSFINVNEDGTFTLKSVLPMRYRLVVQGPGAFVKSAWLGSTDVSSQPFDVSPGAAESLKIVLSTNTATIAGTAPAGQMVFVARAGGEPGQNFLSTTADQTGHFTAPGLAPGKYRLLAGENGTQPDQVQEEGQEVTVGEGETVTVEVKPPAQ